MSFNALNQVAVPRQRNPSRCSLCRQTGHNRRSCTDTVARVNSAGVHFNGQIYNMYSNPRDNLHQFVYGFIRQNVLELDRFSRLDLSLFEDLYFFVQGMAFRELTSALKNPRGIIHYGVAFLCIEIRTLPGFTEAVAAVNNQRPSNISQLNNFLSYIRTPQNSTSSRLLGRDYASNIEVEKVDSKSKDDDVECFICSDQICSVKTGCGHDYCITCVIKIVSLNNDKTTAPFCSFCKSPFEKFIVSEPSVFETLDEFITNLA